MTDAPGPGAVPPPETPLPREPAPAPTGGADDAGRTGRIDALAEYFRVNGATYTPEALRRAAAEAGYEPRDIDAAWAVSAVPVRSRGTSSRAILTVVGYFVGVIVVAALLASVPETSILGLPALGLGVVLAIVAWLSLRDSNPALAEAFRLGVVIFVVVPVVLVLVLAGICVVLIAGYGALASG